MIKYMREEHLNLGNFIKFINFISNYGGEGMPIIYCNSQFATRLDNAILLFRKSQNLNKKVDDFEESEESEKDYIYYTYKPEDFVAMYIDDNEIQNPNIAYIIPINKLEREDIKNGKKINLSNYDTYGQYCITNL